MLFIFLSLKKHLSSGIFIFLISESTLLYRFLSKIQLYLVFQISEQSFWQIGSGGYYKSTKAILKEIYVRAKMIHSASIVHIAAKEMNHEISFKSPDYMTALITMHH